MALKEKIKIYGTQLINENINLSIIVRNIGIIADYEQRFEQIICQCEMPVWTVKDLYNCARCGKILPERGENKNGK